MIIGIIHKGSGLGDQLFSYIATRVRAADLGVDFGFVGKEFFKGASFMNLNWGKPYGIDVNSYWTEEGTGKLVLNEPRFELKYGKLNLFEINKPYYDPEFNFIPDGTIIDGYGAQDIRYFEHRLDEVREWLKVEPLDLPDNLCVINFRGGEYQAVPDLFLPPQYWSFCIGKAFESGAESFEVHTDDKELAKQWFRDKKVIRDIALNWRSIRYAKHLIISNSAFAILPALLNENVKEVIAPKFWAGRNVSEWRRPGNYYKKFTYV